MMLGSFFFFLKTAIYIWKQLTWLKLQIINFTVFLVNKKRKKKKTSQRTIDFEW